MSTGNQIYVVQSSAVKDLSSSPADLSVTLSAPATASTGSAITCTATVKNLGPNSAQGIALSSTLADSVIVGTVTPSQGSCGTGSEFNCSLGTLASGSSATVSVSVTPTVAATIQSTATVSSVSYDSASGNNQSTTSTTVTGTLYSMLPAVSTISPALVAPGAGSSR